MQFLLNERLAKIKAGLEELLILASEPVILWQDAIQIGEYPWGFDGISTVYSGDRRNHVNTDF